MTFTDLRHTLQNVVDTGKLGTPVSMRVHLQLPGKQGDASAALSSVLAMLAPCLNEEPAELQSRRHARHAQTSVLLQTPGGKTVFVTIGFGSANQTSLNLLVVGNHGIAQLEGAGEFAL